MIKEARETVNKIISKVKRGETEDGENRQKKAKVKKKIRTK